MVWMFRAAQVEPVSYFVVVPVTTSPDLSNGVCPASLTNAQESSRSLFSSEKDALQLMNDLKNGTSKDYCVVNCARKADAERFLTGDLKVDVGREQSSCKYYAIYVPMDGGTQETNLDQGGVFGSKEAADQHLKSVKKLSPRLKPFGNFLDAEAFSLTGDLPGAPRSKVSYGLREPHTTESVAKGEERPLPFKLPPRDELKKMRMSIEKNDLSAVQNLVAQNPCFLVNSNSGDSPTLLHEGPRYNAMIIAARSGSLDCAVFILNSISDASFILRLYQDDEFHQIEERISVLRAAYINTPDKMRFRTPLHWAVSKRNLEFVRFLLSQPEIHPALTDGSQQTVLHTAVEAKDFVLFSKLACDPKIAEAIARDREILATFIKDTFSTNETEKQKYLNVLTDGKNPSETLQAGWRVGLYRDFDFSQSPVIQKFEGEPPLVKNDSSISSKLATSNEGLSFFLAAMIGPCSAEDATKIEKEWMRCSRSAEGRSLKLTDIHKGMECIGRRLAGKYGLPWKEYWPFIGPSSPTSPASPTSWIGGKYADLSTPEGLSALEQHLRRSSKLTASASQTPKTCPRGRSIRMSAMGSPYAPALLGRPAWSDKAETRFRSRLLGSRQLNFAEEDADVSTQLQFHGEETEENFEDSRSDFSDYECDDEQDSGEKRSTTELTPSCSDVLYTQSNPQLAAETTPGEDCLQTESENPGKDCSSSDDSFETPPASPPNAEFVMGERPSKIDEDVLRAMSPATVDGKQFPLVYKWQKYVNFFPERERKNWPGPDSVRFKEN